MFSLALAFLVGTVPLHAQGYSAKECPSCAEWNAPHAPVKLFGNSYYVGTNGLSAVLVTSPAGHILIDGGLPESASHILANIATLGFRATDVKIILNSHDHYDHAGGIAELARVTGATVMASPTSAVTMQNGRSGPNDPQFAVILPMPKVPRVQVINDGDTVRVGPLALAATFTPGHTAGGTSWSWRSCEGSRCIELVYADSQTPISDDTFRYSGDPRYPNARTDFIRGHAAIAKLRCDILITPHPGSSQLWERMATPAGSPGSLIDPEACTRYATSARRALDARLAKEQTKK
jgi:metallo-beta-lactamase class B